MFLDPELADGSVVADGSSHLAILSGAVCTGCASSAGSVAESNGLEDIELSSSELSKPREYSKTGNPTSEYS